MWIDGQTFLKHLLAAAGRCAPLFPGFSGKGCTVAAAAGTVQPFHWTAAPVKPFAKPLDGRTFPEPGKVLPSMSRMTVARQQGPTVKKVLPMKGSEKKGSTVEAR